MSDTPKFKRGDKAIVARTGSYWDRRRVKIEAKGHDGEWKCSVVGGEEDGCPLYLHGCWLLPDPEPEPPKFKRGDKVILTYLDGIETELVIAARFDDRDWWLETAQGYVVGWAEEKRIRPAPVPEPPKFKPGDEVIVDDKTDTRHGQSLWLAERRVGLIARRPYWIARETPEGNPHIAITEDSIKAGAPAPKPAIPTLEERQAALRTRSAELAKASPLHDGQAVTSSVKADPEPRGPSILREPLRWMSTGFHPDKVEGHPFARVDIADQLARAQTASATTVQPTTVTIVEGIERWRLLDPAHRRVSTQAAGHTVEVWITVLPSLATHQTKFMMGDTAERVAGWLSDLAKLAEAHPDAEISARMARNPAFKFYGDSGEIEP